MDTRIRMAESLHCSPESITTLLIEYTPIHGEGNGNHSSIPAWRIPWTGEPGRL